MFVTQLSSNVGISFWWIVWVTRSCRERCVELCEYFIQLSWVSGRKQGILSLSFPQNSSNNLYSCTDAQTFWSIVAMQLYLTSNGRLFPCFDQMTLNLTIKVVSFPPGLGAGEIPCALFRTTDELSPITQVYSAITYSKNINSSPDTSRWCGSVVCS